MDMKPGDHLQKVRSCTSRDLASRESIRRGGVLSIMRIDFERHHSCVAGRKLEGSDDRLAHSDSTSHCTSIANSCSSNNPPCRQLPFTAYRLLRSQVRRISTTRVRICFPTSTSQQPQENLDLRTTKSRRLFGGSVQRLYRDLKRAIQHWLHCDLAVWKYLSAAAQPRPSGQVTTRV